MHPETLYSVANLGVLPGWLLLMIAPRWLWTQKVVINGIYSGVLAVIYVMMVLLFFPQAEGNFNTLAGVQKLFTDPYLLLTGWVHYLAFDLLVGGWIVQDSQKRRVKHGFVIPCLVLTLLFGPAGWLSYTVVSRIPVLRRT